MSHLKPHLFLEINTFILKRYLYFYVGMVILENTLHACLKSLSIIHTNCTAGSKSVYMCSEIVIGVYYTSISVNYEIYFALIVI